MSFEERMDLFFQGIVALKERQDQFDASVEKLKERHDALTMNLELVHHDIQDLKAAIQQDAENIRALARVA